MDRWTLGRLPGHEQPADDGMAVPKAAYTAEILVVSQVIFCFDVTSILYVCFDVF